MFDRDGNFLRGVFHDLILLAPLLAMWELCSTGSLKMPSRTSVTVEDDEA